MNVEQSNKKHSTHNEAFHWLLPQIYFSKRSNSVKSQTGRARECSLQAMQAISHQSSLSF